MHIGIAAVLMAYALLAGCSNMSSGSLSDTQPQGIPCDADPPNQPGCHSRQVRDGWWNDRKY